MSPLGPDRPAPGRSVSVAIACICSADHLERCLAALSRQDSAVIQEVVVRYDPALRDIDRVKLRFPKVDISCSPGERTPLELAAAALRECRGDVVLLTEDHCVPEADWVRTMERACQSGRGAVGGRIEVRRSASAVDWAFYFVDFFRYAGPVTPGRSSNLTVCNVAYDRRQLEAVRETWDREFNEPDVHESLRRRFGPLWLVDDSVVVMHRSVAFLPALRERYAFGRIFGHKRVEEQPAARRLVYAALTPALPLLLLARMLRKAVRSPQLARRFSRSLVPLLSMVLCWSWGEFTGYLLGTPPRRLVLAPTVTRDNEQHARAPIA